MEYLISLWNTLRGRKFFLHFPNGRFCWSHRKRHLRSPGWCPRRPGQQGFYKGKGDSHTYLGMQGAHPSSQAGQHWRGPVLRMYPSNLPGNLSTVLNTGGYKVLYSEMSWKSSYPFGGHWSGDPSTGRSRKPMAESDKSNLGPSEKESCSEGLKFPGSKWVSI